MRHFYILSVLFLLAVFVPIKSYAACTAPVGAAGDMIYNNAHNIMQYCNDTDWVGVNGGGGGGGGGSDTLAALACNNNETIKYDGSAWVCAAMGGADNLGDHIATANVQLGSFYLSGDGGSEGLIVDASGNVSMSADLRVTGRDIYFGAGNQRMQGDSMDNFFFTSGSTFMSLVLENAAGTDFGSFVGDSGNNLGIKDGDGSWAIRSVKDTFVDFAINGTTEMEIYPNYVDVKTNKIQNVADPTAAQDAATKAYVDANASGIPNQIFAGTTLTSGTAYTVTASVVSTGIYFLASSGVSGCGNDDSTSLQAHIGTSWVTFGSGSKSSSGSTTTNNAGVITMIMDGTKTLYYTSGEVSPSSGVITGLWDGTIKKNNTQCSNGNFSGGARIK